MPNIFLPFFLAVREVETTTLAFVAIGLGLCGIVIGCAVVARCKSWWKRRPRFRDTATVLRFEDWRGDDWSREGGMRW